MKVDKHQIAQNEIAMRLGMAQIDAILKEAENMELRKAVRDLEERLAKAVRKGGQEG